MILWASQCFDSGQILWRGGYPQVLDRVYHNGEFGIATFAEVVYR